MEVEGPRASRGTPQSSHTRDAAGLRPEGFLYAHTWHSHPPPIASAARPLPPLVRPPSHPPSSCSAIDLPDHVPTDVGGADRYRVTLGDEVKRPV